MKLVWSAQAPQSHCDVKHAPEAAARVVGGSGAAAAGAGCLYDPLANCMGDAKSVQEARVGEQGRGTYRAGQGWRTIAGCEGPEQPPKRDREQKVRLRGQQWSVPEGPGQLGALLG